MFLTFKKMSKPENKFEETIEIEGKRLELIVTSDFTATIRMQWQDNKGKYLEELSHPHLGPQKGQMITRNERNGDGVPNLRYFIYEHGEQLLGYYPVIGNLVTKYRKQISPEIGQEIIDQEFQNLISTDSP